MKPQACHQMLRYVAAVFGAVNLLYCFIGDTREWLVYFDPWFVTIVVYPAFVVALPAIAFLLPLHVSGSSLARWLALCFVSSMLALFEAVWLLMLLIATYFRGPLWNFYWPWEERLPKVVALNNIDLSEYVWISFLDQNRPTDPILRESFGITLLSAHLFIVPLVAAVVLHRKSAIPRWRALLLAAITQLLLLLLIKIAMQHAINLKYFISLPEHGLSI